MPNSKNNINDDPQLKLDLNDNKIENPVAADMSAVSPAITDSDSEMKAEHPENSVEREKPVDKKFPPATAASIGAFLLDSRTRADLSLNQVATITKIHIHYLEAMEREDFKSTPPFTYVKAYVKKLCTLYEADSDYGIQLLAPHFKTVENNVPDKIIRNLEENKQVDARQVAIVRLWIKTGLISALSALVLIAAICFFTIKGKSKTDVADRPLTSDEKQLLVKDMEKLITPQSLAFREIKTPAKSGKQ